MTDDLLGGHGTALCMDTGIPTTANQLCRPVGDRLLEDWVVELSLLQHGQRLGVLDNNSPGLAGPVDALERHRESAVAG